MTGEVKGALVMGWHLSSTRDLSLLLYGEPRGRPEGLVQGCFTAMRCCLDEQMRAQLVQNINGNEAEGECEA